MTSIRRIQEFLGLKRFAFVGLSRQPNDLSRSLFREFVKRGYEPVPVNPDAADLDGRHCFARLEEIQPPVDAAFFMTAPAVTHVLVHECTAVGITKVWMFRGVGQGAASPETIRFCEANGISVVPGECPFMFWPGTEWVHRVHGFVRKITGAYPQ